MLADACSSGWQMPAVSADALNQLMTDVRAPLGRQHFITLACSPPRWIQQPAWQTPRPTSLHHPLSLPATPIYSHTHTHIPASISQALLHQTAIILATSGSHANASRCIHSGQARKCVCVCVCVFGLVNMCVNCWADTKSALKLESFSILLTIMSQTKKTSYSIDVKNSRCDNVAAHLPFWPAGRLHHRRHTISVQALCLREVDYVENDPLKDKTNTKNS